MRLLNSIDLTSENHVSGSINFQSTQEQGQQGQQQMHGIGSLSGMAQAQYSQKLVKGIIDVDNLTNTV